MSPPPARPQIFHIVHVDRLASILSDGRLFSDARMIERLDGSGTTIGMGSIKRRRLELPVRCHQGDRVGEYVPFYFCPRSIMLYVIHCANHPELSYKGGQNPIIHLEADLKEVVGWADGQDRRWAFTLTNAGELYTTFRSNLDDLEELDWDAIRANEWRMPEVKEAKQSEFLVHKSFPWHLIKRIGVRSMAVNVAVDEALRNANHKPKVEIKPDWYY
jgi:hypothetical protein